jgi:NAD(P)-dependent dehydrogenase (short-subunit alcohol dehydrogenase family)
MSRHDIKSVLITGANAGIGREIALQLAANENIATIYLACRNEQKAVAARQELEAKTHRAIFKIVIMDVTDLASVRSTLSSLREPIDALILNAGVLAAKRRWP